MTARELCNYLIAVANGDYEVRISDFNSGSNIIFTKFIEGDSTVQPKYSYHLRFIPPQDV